MLRVIYISHTSMTYISLAIRSPLMLFTFEYNSENQSKIKRNEFLLFLKSRVMFLLVDINEYETGFQEKPVGFCSCLFKHKKTRKNIETFHTSNLIKTEKANHQREPPAATVRIRRPVKFKTDVSFNYYFCRLLNFLKRDAHHHVLPK